MGYPLFAVALLLPWLGGYWWLAAAENRATRGRANPARQVGYGLFLGYGALQGIVLACNSILGHVTVLPVLILLTLLTVTGGMVFRITRHASPSGTPAPVEERTRPAIEHVLFWLFLGGAAVHLVFIAIEILHRPVFPWDAWLNWMYRAKAWFYSGHIFAMDEPVEWLRGSIVAPYNVDGAHYPTFVPVLGVWAATALGAWSETLVNLPVLCCGIALGLGLYGQCRDFGLEKWSSALAVYLLLSIPLVDAHLSLAGQSDIWMAGFSGLGFIALLHGIIRNDWFQILLGLGMTAIGIATKTEGTVWFLAALLTLSLARYTRVTVSLILALAAAAALAWIMGTTYAELPVLGPLGIADGRLHIPLLGSYALQSLYLWDDYRENFFFNGTWHLLWLFILLSVVGLKFIPAGILRRTVAAFYVVVLMAQLLIFGGTEQGMWADDWTAINRLPMHFAPPLVFSILIVLQALGPGTRFKSSLRPQLVATTVSLLIVLAGAVVYLLIAYPGDGEGTAKTFTAREMRIVAGGGRLAGHLGIIDQYQNNIAIVSSGPVQIDPRHTGLARVETAGANRNRATFFWRNGNGPDDLHSADIAGRGTHWVNLDDFPEWRGQVTEIGIVFYADDNRPVEFHEVRMVPQGLLAQLARLAQDWRETSTWSQTSVHWLQAGAVGAAVPLPALVCAWVLVALLVAAVTARPAAPIYSSVLVCALAGWLVLDARWTANTLAQTRSTLNDYPLATATELDFGEDKATRHLVDSARPELEAGGKRTIITAEDDSMRFQALRAKYHALPAATLVYEGPIDNIPAQLADYILVLKKPYYLSGDSPPTAADYADIIRRRGDLRATAVWDHKEGFLLSIAAPQSSRPGQGP